MSNNFQVLSVRRIKTIAGAANVAKHNLRMTDIREYVDTGKTGYNSYDGIVDSHDFTRLYNAILEDNKLTRKPQKNASRVVEFVISTSHDYCSDWENNICSKQKLDSYFSEAANFIEKKYGNVIICSAIHFDETTPHMHLLCIPLCFDREKNTVTFSSSRFLGGFKEMHSLHNEFHDQVGKQFGLERGEEGSRAKHQGLKQYKKWENSQKRKIIEERETNDKRTSDLENRESTLVRKELAVKERETKIINREHNYDEYEKTAFSRMPVIPEIPDFSSKEQRLSWRKSLQEKFNTVFLTFKVKYDKLVSRFNSLLSMYNEATKNLAHWKSRAEQAEQDLAQKPLPDIKADRDRAAARKLSYNEDWSY